MTDATTGKSERVLIYRVFESHFSSWEKLCGDAADFATIIGPEDVLSISHSQEGTRGVVVVWYWKSS